MVAYAFIDDSIENKSINFQVDDEKFMFLKCLLKSIKQRVIVIREDLQQ